MLTKASKFNTWYEYRQMWGAAVQIFVDAESEAYTRVYGHHHITYLQSKLRRLIWQTEQHYGKKIEAIMELRNMNFLKNTLTSALIQRVKKKGTHLS